MKSSLGQINSRHLDIEYEIDQGKMALRNWQIACTDTLDRIVCILEDSDSPTEMVDKIREAIESLLENA